MTVQFTPLSDLNHQQIDKVLAKFQLISRYPNTKDRIEVIKCIKSYDVKFSKYADNDVLVGFNKGGHFQDIKSKDESVKLFKDIAPCNTCGRCVDDKEVGLRCCGCTEYFHNKCTSSPVSSDSFKHIVNTPAWVKVFCPKCVSSYHKSEESLQTIDKKLSDLRNDLIEKIEKKTNDQTKKWTDLFKQDRDSEQVEQVVTQAVERSKQKMDYDHMEREKRKKNIVIRKIEESSADTTDEKKEEDKAIVINILGLDNDDIEYVRRAGKLDEDDPQPRPLIITVKTPEMATALHGHGRGRKFRDGDNEDIWCNPDLIAADRTANYFARKERKKRRDENLVAAGAGDRTRRGSFLRQSQTRER